MTRVIYLPLFISILMSQFFFLVVRIVRFLEVGLE